MNDRYDENLFLGYVEDELDPAQRRQFELAMAADPVLAELVTQVQQDRQGLRQLPDEQAPGEMIEAVRQRLERSMLLDQPATTAGQPGGDYHRYRLARWVGYGSIAALLFLSAGLLLHTLMQDTLPTPHLAQTPPTAAADPTHAPFGNQDRLAMAEPRGRLREKTGDRELELTRLQDAQPPRAGKGGGGPNQPVIAAGDGAPVQLTSSASRLEILADDAVATEQDLRAWAGSNMVMYFAPSQNVLNQAAMVQSQTNQGPMNRTAPDANATKAGQEGLADKIALQGMDTSVAGGAMTRQGSAEAAQKQIDGQAREAQASHQAEMQTQQVVLILPADKVPALLHHLNRNTQQSANLVTYQDTAMARRDRQAPAEPRPAVEGDITSNQPLAVEGPAVAAQQGPRVEPTPAGVNTKGGERIPRPTNQRNRML